MLQAIRRHVSPAGLIATLALILAMSGGAYAASRFVITSTKQISPKVLKALKGNAGAKGAAGPTGPAGPGGPTGPAGPTGPQGAAGAKGETGAAGAPGAKGADGKEGSPWTVSGTLPSGKTEEGSWSVQSNVENAKAIASVSFPIPLAEGLSEEHVHFIKPGATSTEECPGSVEAPRAAKGEFCAYAFILKGFTFEEGEVITDPAGGFESFGTGESGANLFLIDNQATLSSAWGTWAVTAP